MIQWDLGDTAGTMAQVQSLCKHPGANRLNPVINYPFGFDNSAYAYWNLADHSRAYIARLFGCSTESITWIFSVFPIISLSLTCATAFAFGYAFQKRVCDGLTMFLIGAFSPTIILQTRTSLANNVLFFGFLSLAALVTFLRSKRLGPLTISFSLMVLQIWSNIYVGAAFVLLSLVVLLSYAFEPHSAKFRTRLRAPSIAAVVMLLAIAVGLLPLLRSQWFLLTNPGLSGLARPVDSQRNSLLRTVLVSIKWTPGMIGAAVFSVALGVGRRAKGPVLIPLAFATVIVILNSEGIFIDPINSLYGRIFAPLRGVGYFLSFLPILLAISLIQSLRYNRPLPSVFRVGPVHLKLSVLLVLFMMLEITASLPRTGVRLDSTLHDSQYFTEVSAKYSKNINFSDPVFHLPDFYYYYEPWYGSPGRDIYFDQMAHGMPILNGRDLRTALLNCPDVYSDTSGLNFPILAARGAGFVSIRTQDFREPSLSSVRFQLKESGWLRIQVADDDDDVPVEVWAAPNRPIVNSLAACTSEE